MIQTRPATMDGLKKTRHPVYSTISKLQIIRLVGTTQDTFRSQYIASNSGPHVDRKRH